MPITSSARKASRASKKKRVFNLRRKAAIDKNLNQLRKLIAAKKKSEAEKLIPAVYQALDKAAKTGQIKRNTAARLKSRAMRAIRKIS
jgi:small subunit ribosomal protein S20